MAKFLLNRLLHLLPLLSYLLLSNVISGAELINSSKNNYCINDDVIIESSFIDTLNYAVNWEYALDDNTWKNVSFLNISAVQSKQSLRLHDFTESLSLKIRCIYTDNITYIDSISNILNHY